MMVKDFIVLALYEVHMASAALMVNGDVVAAAHEERFSRLKGDHGFPLKAAQFCLQYAGIDQKDVDIVVMVNDSFNHDGIANILFKRAALYKIDDWIYENERYWKPKLLGNKSLRTYFDIMGGWNRVSDQYYYGLTRLDMDGPDNIVSEIFNEIRKDTVVECLNIPEEKIVFAPHYLCHHYHAYYSGETRGKDVVVVHMEGDGGKYNSAVSVPSPEGLKIIGGSNESNLGRLYQWITLLLGMKPYNHEYKIMGLAPYANEYEVERSYKVFEKIFKVDRNKLAVIYNEHPSDLYFHFQKCFQGHRFDGIAGALQRLLEKSLVEWIRQVVLKTGRFRICYGGGVAMNVKANMLLAQLKEIESLYIPLSPADESNVIGAAYWVTEQHMLKNNRNSEMIQPLKSPYLGSDYSRSTALEASKEVQGENGFYVYEGIDIKSIAKLLSEGRVVAVSQRKAEFGQRALGNRSILAHPSWSGIVDKINKQIKYRDFWMPFCPTILEEDQDNYLDNPKHLEANYMTMAFPVQKRQQKNLQGVIHPGDGTARPQILKRKTNPEYYDLIKEFKSLTGIGALLNTSFNLHGEPIVNSPYDAINTFEKSELDALWMSDILISRHRINNH